MKQRMAGILSLIGLAGAWLVLRYPLLFLHGMKDWPFVLFVVGVVTIAVAGLLFGRKTLPLLTVAGYVLGFAAGYLFQWDYGIGLNNLWIIWSGVYLAAILVGAVLELLGKK